MGRRFSGDRLVIASHNDGKLREIQALVAPHGVTALSALELGLAAPEETGASFAENARIKAEAATTSTGEAALADDSGLAVPALDGAPGIHSARWAGPQRDFAAAMEKLERALESHDDRGAYFACALAIAWPDGHTEVFEGEVHGTLVWPPRGKRGFGYDPMFLPAGGTRTFGEMDPAAKHHISHRAAAFRRFVDACFG